MPPRGVISCGKGPSGGRGAGEKSDVKGVVGMDWVPCHSLELQHSQRLHPNTKCF